MMPRYEFVCFECEPVASLARSVLPPCVSSWCVRCVCSLLVLTGALSLPCRRRAGCSKRIPSRTSVRAWTASLSFLLTTEADALSAPDKGKGSTGRTRDHTNGAERGKDNTTTRTSGHGDPAHACPRAEGALVELPHKTRKMKNAYITTKHVLK
jgi:hypothetical protein